MGWGDREEEGGVDLARRRGRREERAEWERRKKDIHRRK